jgi:hypothetical protein
MEIISVEEYTNALHNFCATVTSGRDESHGVEHMDIVRRNAMNIWECVQQEEHFDEKRSDRLTRLIIAVAQLHDVADHKYGKTEEQLNSVRSILSQFFSNCDVDLVMLIIDNISYSKEDKAIKSGCPLTWNELGEDGLLVRHIVSDADKLEAIGLM